MSKTYRNIREHGRRISWVEKRRKVQSEKFRAIRDITLRNWRNER